MVHKVNMVEMVNCQTVSEDTGQVKSFESHKAPCDASVVEMAKPHDKNTLVDALGTTFFGTPSRKAATAITAFFAAILTIGLVKTTQHHDLTSQGVYAVMLALMLIAVVIKAVADQYNKGTETGSSNISPAR